MRSITGMVRPHFRKVARRGGVWLLAILVNGLALAALLLVSGSSEPETREIQLLTRVEEDPPEVLNEEILPVLLERRPIEQYDTVIEEPVIKDAKVSDYNETDSDMPYEAPLGVRDLLSGVPLGRPSYAPTGLGIGGGAHPGQGVRLDPRLDEPLPVDREGYDAIEENVFHDPWRTPLSTFSIDVDTASYANVRRMLRTGMLPPRGAVRIEEMINYFTYDYPEPEGDAPFSVSTEVAECPWKPGHRLVRIGLRGRLVEEDRVPPRNLVFLLDVSGSMNSVFKLPLVKKAMKLLVDRLREEDRVAIVVYAGASGMALGPTSGSLRREIHDAIDRLSAGGSTNGAQGIRLAYQLAGENFRADAINRVILATDGDFNVGVTSRSELVALIEEERERGVFLTVLGVGTGNIQDSQLEMLADRGNGNYAYLDSLAEAKKVLVREAGSTLVTIAKDVKIQVEFNPNIVGAYRLIGYENRKLRARDFNDDKKDAGEIGAGHRVTALYQIAPAGEGPDGEGIDPLRYRSEGGLEGPAFGGELLTVKLRYKEPDGEESRLLSVPVEDPGNVSFAAASPDFRLATTVAGFGIALRSWKEQEQGAPGPALAVELAGSFRGDDVHCYRREFARLAERAARLIAAAR